MSDYKPVPEMLCASSSSIPEQRANFCRAERGAGDIPRICPSPRVGNHFQTAGKVVRLAETFSTTWRGTSLESFIFQIVSVLSQQQKTSLRMRRKYLTDNLVLLILLAEQ
jgi:hypothetical protein